MAAAPLLVFSLVALGCGRALAYEEPAYEVVRTLEGFELRLYAPQLVAEIEVGGEFEDVGNEAFRVLFGFISGKNQRSETLAMTAPVTQSPADARGERIAMTAPVTQLQRSATTSNAAAGYGTYAFQFAMPAAYTRETLPEPVDPRVRILELEPRLLAARRFSGTWRRANYQANETALLAAVTRDGFEIAGPPIFARYNAPFVPWFLRRNEVLVEVRTRTDPSP